MNNGANLLVLVLQLPIWVFAVVSALVYIAYQAGRIGVRL